MQPRRRNSLLRYVPILLLLVLFAGLAIYSATHKTSPVSAFGQNYKNAVPGGCNATDQDWWELSGQFKTLGTPTAINTNTASKETPTPYVVRDNSVVATCQRDGLHIQHNNHYNIFAQTIFHGNAPETLPQHFSTQITATVLNASNAASFLLGVRRQSNGEQGTNRGYGDDGLVVHVNGSWQTVRYNNITDQIDTTFTRGFIQPAQTITLGAEVEGSRITFSIDGKNLLPIVDTTYPSGYGIGFGLADRDATNPTSVVYSHFSYQPLTSTNLTNHTAVATATPQANQLMHTTYTATTPGFGCDQNGGQWKPVTEENNYATASCQSNGLALAQGSSTQYIGHEPFYGLNGYLPTDYSISVQIDTSQIPKGCAGLMTRKDTHSAGYYFEVCHNGHWAILRYGSNGGDAQKLIDGFGTMQTSYAMIATSNGDTQSLSLGGVTVATISDSTLQTTDHIDLCVYAGQGTTGTAVFSNFTFTPIF